MTDKSIRDVQPRLIRSLRHVFMSIDLNTSPELVAIPVERLYRKCFLIHVKTLNRVKTYCTAIPNPFEFH